MTAIDGAPDRPDERTAKGGALVVYGAGSNQVPVLEACRRRGWRVIAIDRNPNACGVHLADRFVCASLRDHAAILKELEGEIVRGIVARITDQQALESSRRLAEDRGLAAPCRDLLAASTSKVALGEICRAANLPTPRRCAFGQSVSPGQGFVIVRPDVTVRGKAGISRTNRAEAVATSIVEAAACSANGEVDVCEWIEGADVSVLAQLDHGRGRRLAVWDEWVAIDAQGTILGLGSGMPSLFAGDSSAIDSLLEAVAKRFSRSRCLITLSLRLDPAGQPFIIEIHLGIGGDSIADVLIPAALPGVDVFDSLVRTQAGEDWSPPSVEPRPRALLRAGEAWRLVEAPDVESIRRLARASAPADCELPWSLREGGTR